MYNNISSDLDELNAPHLFESLSKLLIELDIKEYNDEEYKENVCKFYAGYYDLP
jgi:hypothetical protein